MGAGKVKQNMAIAGLKDKRKIAETAICHSCCQQRRSARSIIYLSHFDVFACGFCKRLYILKDDKLVASLKPKFLFQLTKAEK